MKVYRCSHGPVGRLPSVKATRGKTGHRPVATTFFKPLWLSGWERDANGCVCSIMSEVTFENFGHS